MPPKPKFTRDDIIEAGFTLVKIGGYAELTARNLGAKLGCSSQPIFTEFHNMEEVRSEVYERILKLYYNYILGKGADSDAFRRIDYIRFASDEPKLFAILFMTSSEKKYAFSDILSVVFTNTDSLIESVQNDYKLSREKAHTLCCSMWLFIHGLACTCAMGMTLFIEDEVQKLVNDTFEAILQQLRRTS